MIRTESVVGVNCVGSPAVVQALHKFLAGFDRLIPVWVVRPEMRAVLAVTARMDMLDERPVALAMRTDDRIFVGAMRSWFRGHFCVFRVDVDQSLLP